MLTANFRGAWASFQNIGKKSTFSLGATLIGNTYPEVLDHRDWIPEVTLKDYRHNSYQQLAGNAIM